MSCLSEIILLIWEWVMVECSLNPISRSKCLYFIKLYHTFFLSDTGNEHGNDFDYLMPDVGPPN
jgi:hypothetical protein